MQTCVSWMWNAKHSVTVFQNCGFMCEYSHTFTHPAASGCRSGLISVALTLIGACVPWLCVSVEYHAEPRFPSLPFTLLAGPLSLLTTHTMIPIMMPCVLGFLVLLSVFTPQLVALHSLTGRTLDCAVWSHSSSCLSEQSTDSGVLEGKEISKTGRGRLNGKCGYFEKQNVPGNNFKV